MRPNDSQPVLAAPADLLFAARMRAAAQAAGVQLRLVRPGEDLVAVARDSTPRLVILDLDARWLDGPAVIAALKADPLTAQVPVVGYVSHVREDAIAGARAAGAERVLARSAFVKVLSELLRP